MDEPIREPVQRTLSPAVLASAAFVALCAVIAVTFVAARGGLQMPVAPNASAVAVASAAPTSAPTEPVATAPSSPMPSEAEPSAAPSSPPSAAPSAAPTHIATAAPSPTPEGTPDPLTALPACPGIAGCFQYRIQRDDTLSGVASRYAIPVATVLALNPEVDDPSTIVVGQILYLGRDPVLRLEPCPDTVSCWLYVVQPGDRLSTIAARYDVPIEAILAANPGIDDPNEIFSGQVIRLRRSED